jgi:hypothetical protein
LVGSLALAGTGTYAGLGGFSAATSSSATTSSSQSPVVKSDAGNGPPPAPAITSGPGSGSPRQTLNTTATFTYSDSRPGVTFECSLNGSGYSACGGPGSPSRGSVTYSQLLPGSYAFSVEAAHGTQVSSPTNYAWQINGQPFTMSWTAPQLFYPGTSQAANVTISNPDPKAITIPKTGDPGGLAITVTSSNPANCPSGNFGVTRGLLVSVTIPANTSETFSQAGVPSADWPVIAMFDGSGGANSHSNQNGCQGVGITVSFSAMGSGT